MNSACDADDHARRLLKTAGAALPLGRPAPIRALVGDDRGDAAAARQIGTTSVLTAPRNDARTRCRGWWWCDSLMHAMCRSSG